MLRIARQRENIEVADGWSAPTERPDDIGLIERGRIVETQFEIVSSWNDLPEQYAVLTALCGFDLFENILLYLLAEILDRSDTPLFSGFF